MNARKLESDCAWVRQSLDAFADGELDAGHAVDVEAHMEGCAECRAGLEAEQLCRRSLKRIVRRPAPDALREKLCARLEAERVAQAQERDVEREEERAEARAADARGDEDAKGPRLVQFGYTAALAAAAGLALAFGTSRQWDVNFREERPTQPAEASVVSFDNVLDDFVAMHASPIPPETTDPDDIAKFEPWVGVPMRRTAAFEPLGGKFRGGRMNIVRAQPAAVLQYQTPGQHRVTVYVFNTRAIPFRIPQRLQERMVQQRAVYVGRVGGYSVAALDTEGVGYAVASDLDDDTSARLVASVGRY
jgi:anti-sigma factor (TIGR02949 family)